MARRQTLDVVLVGFGVPNEIRKDDSAKSTPANSPGGILYDVMFDGDRLKGPALDVAMSHMAPTFPTFAVQQREFEAPLFTVSNSVLGKLPQFLPSPLKPNR